VPHEVAGIVFLSGGQGPLQATENLQAIGAAGRQPWPITFSYSRAVQDPAMDVWMGKPENVDAARKVFLHRLQMNSLARMGKYTTDIEIQE
jgi:fructose-bisphosphate aldolase class I